MTYLMVHNPDISLTDIIRKERSDTIGHLIQHRAQTPPVRFDAIALFSILQRAMGKQVVVSSFISKASKASSCARRISGEM